MALGSVRGTCLCFSPPPSLQQDVIGQCCARDVCSIMQGRAYALRVPQKVAVNFRRGPWINLHATISRPRDQSGRRSGRSVRSRLCDRPTLLSAICKSDGPSPRRLSVPSIHLFFPLTAFRLRPPAIVAARPPLSPPPAPDPPSLGVAAPLPGTSEPSSVSSTSLLGPSPLVLSIALPSRLVTFPQSPDTRARNHVLLIDGGIAVSLFTGSRLPSGSS